MSNAAEYLGGGASLLHQATVTLTNDEIKEWPTEPIPIVEAQGENLVTFPLVLIIQIDTTAGEYTNVNASFNFIVSAANNRISDLESSPARNLLNEGAPASWLIDPVVDRAVNSMGATSNFANKQIRVFADNADGNFTGGNAANTGRLTLGYLTFNTLTGQFV